MLSLVDTLDKLKEIAQAQKPLVYKVDNQSYAWVTASPNRMRFLVLQRYNYALYNDDSDGMVIGNFISLESAWAFAKERAEREKFGYGVRVSRTAIMLDEEITKSMVYEDLDEDADLYCYYPHNYLA